MLWMTNQQHRSFIGGFHPWPLGTSCAQICTEAGGSQDSFSIMDEVAGKLKKLWGKKSKKGFKGSGHVLGSAPQQVT